MVKSREAGIQTLAGNKKVCTGFNDRIMTFRPNKSVFVVSVFIIYAYIAG